MERIRAIAAAEHTSMFDIASRASEYEELVRSAVKLKAFCTLINGFVYAMDMDEM